MTVTIEVYRGAGNRRGDDINEPLLGESLSAALARGRGELDANAHPRMSTDLELVAPHFDLRLGDLIEVSDATHGVTWRGKLVGIKHSCAVGDAPTIITLERATDA